MGCPPRFLCWLSCGLQLPVPLLPFCGWPLVVFFEVPSFVLISLWVVPPLAEFPPVLLWLGPRSLRSIHLLLFSQLIVLSVYRYFWLQLGQNWWLSLIRCLSECISVVVICFHGWFFTQFLFCVLLSPKTVFGIVVTFFFFQFSFDIFSGVLKRGWCWCSVWLAYMFSFVLRLCHRGSEKLFFQSDSPCLFSVCRLILFGSVLHSFSEKSLLPTLSKNFVSASSLGLIIFVWNWKKWFFDSIF